LLSLTQPFFKSFITGQLICGLIAQALKRYQAAVMCLAEVNGFGVDSAQQLIAEVAVLADAFPSAGQFSSWVGTCPGSNVTAGKL
jgi:transposase